MNYLIPLFLFLILISCNSVGKQNSDHIQENPNIIYINMDDLGIEELQIYNKNAPLPTPNLTRMAAEGMKFTKHYAGTSVCAPSRCALMTGMHTGHAEVRGNKQWEPHGQMPISDSTVTVAELLKNAGYRTALFGKWGLGVEGTSGEPTKQGFDTYYGYLDQVLAHNAFPEYLMRDGKREQLDNQVVWQSPETMFKGWGSYTPKENQKVYANDLFTKEALNYLTTNNKKPFFLYIAYTIPHNNGEAPKEDRFESPDLEPFTNENWTETEKRYAASIARMDHYIGQILKKLEETGLSKNTVVFFTSDNGSTEDIPTRFAGHNKLRGMKRSPYEGGIRAPLLVWWKGKIQPGTTNDDLVAQWDFLPTACALAGIEPPKGIDGVAMNAIIKQDNKDVKSDVAYFEFYEQGGWQTVRDGAYKLIFSHKGQIYELYNLNNDPGESNNLVNKNPEELERLKKLLSSERTESPHFEFPKSN